MKHETKRLIAGAPVLASLIAPGLAAAQQLAIVDAWARATPTGVETAAALFEDREYRRRR
jgi:copper(I)-binding protein